MKTIVSSLLVLLFLLIFQSSSPAQQKINGPTTVCANTPTGYTFSGVCPDVSQWSAAPGVILTDGTKTTVNATFPTATVDRTYRIFAAYTCGAGSGTAFLDVTVKGTQTYTTTTDVPCYYVGDKTFMANQPYQDSRTIWTNTAGWPVVSGPVPVKDDAGAWFSKITYNVNNRNTGTITASVIDPTCPNAPVFVSVTNVTRSTSNSLPAPTFTQNPTQQCVGASGIFSVQPYANAISYTWNADRPILINNSLPPVTISAANNGNTVTIREAVSTYNTNITVTAVSACGQTLPASTPLTIGAINTEIVGPTLVWPGDVCDYLIDPPVSAPGLGTVYNWIAGGATIMAGQNTAHLRLRWNSNTGGPTTVYCQISNAAAACGTTLRVSLDVLIGDRGVFSIAPNPATNTLKIMPENTSKLKQSGTGTALQQQPQISEVVVADKFNNIKKIIKFPPNTRNASVDINNLPPDVYILRIRNKDTWISKKFVVAPH
jgi:hypothetical protein